MGGGWRGGGWVVGEARAVTRDAFGWVGEGFRWAGSYAQFPLLWCCRAPEIAEARQSGQAVRAQYVKGDECVTCMGLEPTISGSGGRRLIH